LFFGVAETLGEAFADWIFFIFSAGFLKTKLTLVSSLVFF
jgi:hypothetical protein